MTEHPLFQVNKPGALTSFQDLGRYGYQQYGVPVSGAMDPYALQLANLLVGNRRETVALEVTLIGPELVVLSDCIIALTGADLSPTLNGKAIPMWQTLRLQEGDILKLGSPKLGVRLYIAVAGGYHVPERLQSQSTYTKANLGKPLEKGDVVYGQGGSIKRHRGFISSVIPQYKKEIQCRVLPGLHTDLFTQSFIETFYASTFTVSTQADRMGYRLEMEKPLLHEHSLISDAVAGGSIQLPTNGEPIILLADRQTTGGYPMIANVITVDLPSITQLAPGGKITFKEVTIEEAQQAYKARERQLRFFEHIIHS